MIPDANLLSSTLDLLVSILLLGPAISRDFWVLGQEKFSGCHVSQSIMWPLFVVLPQPLFRLFTNLVQTLEHVHVEHRLAIGAIESFDKAVLHWFAWFDELEHHTMLFSPFSQRQRNEFRTIV